MGKPDWNRDREIFERYEAGEKQAELSRKFGLSAQRIHQIVAVERNKPYGKNKNKAPSAEIENWRDLVNEVRIFAGEKCVSTASRLMRVIEVRFGRIDKEKMLRIRPAYLRRERNYGISCEKLLTDFINANRRA